MASSLTLRRDIASLASLASRDLAALRRMSEAEAIEALRDLLPALIATYGSAAATVAAEWYDELRAEREVRRTFQAAPIEAGDRGAQALVGWAAATATNDEGFWTLINGGIQRRIADHSRLTVMDSSLADPSAVGWRRVGAGECGFCSMLLGRGAVYSEATADFAAHDHCQCGAEPDF